MKSISTIILTCLIISVSGAQNDATNDFVSLFDGTSLDGWTASIENPQSFKVEDGALICKGGRAHIFYTGTAGNADFKNFELKLKVKTTQGSNSGVYFHTSYQGEGWPEVGFEAQVNSTHTDPRKTGSLYGIANIWAPKEIGDPFVARITDQQEVFVMQPKAPSTDGTWFDYHIIVKENTITLKVDGITTIEWTQPEGWTRERRIGHGTIGLQAHDPDSEIHYKDIKIKMLD